MRIKELRLQNFRGFEDLTIRFPEKGCAVFVGANGAGKTSVLNALANHFYVLFKDYFQDWAVLDSLPAYPITDAHIRIGTRFCKNELVIRHKEKEGVITCEKARGLDKEQEHKAIPVLQIIGFGHQRLDGEERQFPEFPFFVYYPHGRELGELNIKAQPLTNFDHRTESTVAISGVNVLQNLTTWFRSVEDLENEIRLYRNPLHRDPMLQLIRLVIQTFLPGFGNPRVQRQPFEELILEKTGGNYSITQLSHGEKLMFAMVADIARRLSIAHPEAPNPLEQEGFVLIDEIELHLHPSWQRKIVPLLEKTFPNIQFILTTHSPQVLSRVPRENVFLLENFRLVENTPYTLGRDSNSILYDIFGVEERPEDTQAEFDKLYRLIDDPEKADDAAALLRKLEEKYGPYDPELVRAAMHLEFLTAETVA